PTLTDEERARMAGCLRRKEELPPEDNGKLGLFLLQTGKRRRGPHPSKLGLRNGAIVATMNKLIQFYHVAATRNPASDHDSAASIVSKSLRELGHRRPAEQRINSIFQQFRRELKQILKEEDAARVAVWLNYGGLN